MCHHRIIGWHSLVWGVMPCVPHMTVLPTYRAKSNDYVRNNYTPLKLPSSCRASHLHALLAASPGHIHDPGSPEPPLRHRPMPVPGKMTAARPAGATSSAGARTATAHTRTRERKQSIWLSLTRSW